MKKISVVVPCYNVGAHLDRCMKHLIGQTIGIENIEIILVNDASTDDGITWELITQYESRYPESVIAISLEENLRQGGARNVGISYAGGEYLMFCDADDWLRPEAMEILYTLIRENDADVIEFRNKDVFEYSDAEANMPILQGEQSYCLTMADDEDRRKHILNCTDTFTLGCWNKLYRMSLINGHAIRFVEHLIFEEPSFTLLVRLYERKHIFVDAVLHYCFQTPTGTMQSSWDSRKLDNAKAWIVLHENLGERGLIAQYPAELEYMFWSWGIGLTVSMLLQKRYILQFEELAFLKQMFLTSCPDIKHNPYLSKYEAEWNGLLLEMVNMEFTADNIIRFNKSALQYLADNGQL